MPPEEKDGETPTKQILWMLVGAVAFVEAKKDRGQRRRAKRDAGIGAIHDIRCDRGWRSVWTERGQRDCTD